MFSGLENPTHWLILLAIVLIVMGPKRLPEIGRSLGSSFRGFKDSLEGHNDEPAPRQVTTSELRADAPAAADTPVAEKVPVGTDEPRS